MARVVSVYLPFFATERMRLTSTDLPPEAPLALTTRIGAQRLVAAVDATALAHGLKPGMAATQAQLLLPGLTLRDYAPKADAHGLAKLAAWCLARYSPVVMPSPPDGLLLDVTGCTHLFAARTGGQRRNPDEGESNLLADLAARLARRGLTARLALAGSVGAAHALARFAAADCTRIAETQSLKGALAPLPVEALRLSPETTQALRRLGFERIGDLIGVKRAPITRRFGHDVFLRLDQALGLSREPLVPLIPPELVSARLSFVEPVITAEGLAQAVERLCVDLAAVLETRQHGARRLDLHVTRLDRSTGIVSVRMAKPSRAPEHMARLVCEKLAGLDCGLGVEKVLLAAPLTRPLLPEQIASELYGRPQEPDLSTLVDRLANRLGAGRIYRTAPVESDWPERSVRRVAALAPKPRTETPRPENWLRDWPRPARLLADPMPVEVIALLPDYPPALFIWQGRRHRICRADGPERIFGEWWRAPGEIALARDYFQVEDEAGQRFWLFREEAGNRPQRWYLHGFFA
ncbi:DNA polymerase Y family protein [Afifella sp. H1R]|uniref:DNA polymerase Y family protein n=1 Tax=Afifella sp. H1R TaxID=2908841 RepID=UPI001F266837|nr:DNA polymerase Y family protein [Afifella sp. H1R]MCF1504722.1 DNA polymerase Y family protein [Afifella sp. H1R]